MIRYGVVLLVAGALAGCGDDVIPITQNDFTVLRDLSIPDMEVPPDLTDIAVPPDLTDIAIPPDLTDIAVPPDLTDIAIPPDLTDIAHIPPDLTDLSGLPDLTDALPPPDMAKPYFIGGAVISTGGMTGPYFVATADFNKDKHLDLAVSALSSAQVAILLGNGNGTFQAPVFYVIGVNAAPKGIAIGDYNGDANLDLVVGNINGTTLLTGDGKGAFTVGATTSYGVGTRPRAVVSGDYDDDGNLDVAVVVNALAQVGLSLGNGKGGFGAPTFYNVGNLPIGLDSADYDGDGKLDLAAACNDDGKGATTGQAAVLINSSAKGMPSFKAATFQPVGKAPQFGIGHGDFNKDGKLDLVVTNSTDNSMSYLAGDGKGGFGAQVVVTDIGFSPVSLVVMDVTRGGTLDVVTANSGGVNTSVVRGDGKGGFTSGARYTTDKTPESICSGDFDENGSPDVAVATNTNNNVVILLNNF